MARKEHGDRRDVVRPSLRTNDNVLEDVRVVEWPCNSHLQWDVRREDEGERRQHGEMEIVVYICRQQSKSSNFEGGSIRHGMLLPLLYGSEPVPRHTRYRRAPVQQGTTSQREKATRGRDKRKKTKKGGEGAKKKRHKQLPRKSQPGHANTVTVSNTKQRQGKTCNQRRAKGSNGKRKKEKGGEETKPPFATQQADAP